MPWGLHLTVARLIYVPFTVSTTLCENKSKFLLKLHRHKAKLDTSPRAAARIISKLVITIMDNLMFDYDHPTLRVLFVSTIIILGLLIINDLIPWGPLGRRTRHRESNLVLIILAILALAVEWTVYMFL